jgi:predicted outer membrane protein
MNRLVAFDETYIIGQLEVQDLTITAFESEAPHGSDARLIQFAALAVPILQEHIRVAKQLVGGGA